MHLRKTELKKLNGAWMAYKYMSGFVLKKTLHDIDVSLAWVEAENAEQAP